MRPADTAGFRREILMKRRESAEGVAPLFAIVPSDVKRRHGGCAGVWSGHR